MAARSRFLPVLLAAALAATLAACSESLEEVTARHRPQVDAVFDRLRALSGPAAEAAIVTTDAFALDGATVRLDGDASNALFIFARDLAAPENATDEGIGGTPVSTAVYCGEVMRGEFYGSPKGADVILQECARSEYALVLRTNEEQPALVQGTDSFTPGLYDGDVLLYRLADGALLGGFHVQAESSDEVQVMVDASGVPIDPTERLNSDLSSHVYSVIDAKLRDQVPGVLDPR